MEGADALSSSILSSRTLLREITVTLEDSVRDAAELFRRLVTARPDLRKDLLGTQQSLASFAHEAARMVLQRGLEDVLPHVVQDIPDARKRLGRIALLLGFLRALLGISDIDRLARPIAGLLAPDLPSRHKMLAKIQPGEDFVENLVVPLLDLCLREGIEPWAALVRIGRGLAIEAALGGQDATPLNAWLQSTGGAPPPADLPVMRVLSVRLIANDGRGWTVCWVRGVSPGYKTIKLELLETTVADIHGLWRILRPAAAHLVTIGFVAATDQLILSVEIESSRALEGFHRATDHRRCKQFWTHFGAVTLWPWFEAPDDVGGLRHNSLLHRPGPDAPSETVALYCRASGLEDLRAGVGGRAMLVCTEPVWRPRADGLSAAIETHENRTVSVLVAGDDGEAFLDCLFAHEQSRPFHDLFRAVRQWLTEGKDLHVLWTDPDYKANHTQFEMLSP